MKKYFSISFLLLFLLFPAHSFANDKDKLQLEIHPSEENYRYNVKLFYVDTEAGQYILIANARSKPMKVLELKYGQKIFMLCFKVNTVSIKLPETSLPIEIIAEGIEVRK